MLMGALNAEPKRLRRRMTSRRTLMVSVLIVWSEK